MPPRKSLTRRFLQHLLLISLARTILTVLGRGRAWDEWDEGKLVEPAQERSFQRRFAQTLSFGALFFAGLALSAGAGNSVQSLLESDNAPAAQGASGPSGPTGVAGAQPAPQSASQPRTAVEASGQVAPTRPVAPPTTRVASQAAAPVSRPAQVTTPAATARRTAAAASHVARPSLAPRERPSARKHEKTAPHAPAPAPALDPEAADYPTATVWLNRAGPDPTPPAARLQMGFARQLVAYSRLAHVDWALVLATLRAEGHNGRVPAGPVALRSVAFRLARLGGGASPWAAALAYSSNTTLADRVVALRHYYRAVGLPSLVHGLLAEKADLQDRVLHSSRLTLYPGGRHDVEAGHVDVRVLATLLYLADTFHSVTVSCLISGHRLYARPGVVSAHIYGRAVDVAALNGVSIAGHQQPGGVTEQAVRALMMLPGGMLPTQVISLLGMGGPSFALANHYDHIHIGY